MNAVAFYCAIYYGRRTVSLKRCKLHKRHIDDTRSNALCTPCGQHTLTGQRLSVSTLVLTRQNAVPVKAQQLLISDAAEAADDVTLRPLPQ